MTMRFFALFLLALTLGCTPPARQRTLVPRPAAAAPQTLVEPAARTVEPAAETQSAGPPVEEPRQTGSYVMEDAFAKANALNEELAKVTFQAPADYQFLIYKEKIAFVGQMENTADLKLLFNESRKINGIKKIINYVTLEPLSRKNYQKTADSKLQAALMETIPPHISNFSEKYVLAVYAGTVYALGETDDPAEVRKLLALARRTQGVRNIVNSIEIIRK